MEKRTIRVLLGVGLAAVAGVAITAPGLLTATDSHASTAHATTLDPKTVATMDDITAVFEQGASSPQYANIENDQDGCGFTAGWIGFCTQSGDMLDLVKQYNAAEPDNVLAKYTATLQKLADTSSDDVTALGAAFPSDWKKAAADPVFVQTQLKVGHDTYLTPALAQADQAGVKTNLGIENFFDTALMMGPGETDCDGLPKLVRETTTAAGGTPASGVDEKTWLKAFNQVRAKHMKNPCTPGRQADWPQAVDRTTALQKLADDGNLDLTTPLTIAADFGITISNPHD
ncbi:chitosanase [Kutzneria buriramensis]|uniref:Chitosanase n=1 Tax=Kutzneria buriramensis TaxID=1045776 RepID=A0A3E0H182_9PSEU|nr:chitosanase [Kutzneria buriramensis]REH35313.1 chitosanase [Kutzneria buriramensis]